MSKWLVAHTHHLARRQVYEIDNPSLYGAFVGARRFQRRNDNLR